MESKFSKSENFFATLTLVLLVIIVFGGYKYYSFSKSSKEFEKSATENITTLEQKIKELENNLSGSLNENLVLKEALYTEQSKNEAFAEQIREISGTVGTLEKLSKIDAELLQKYSRVYFLNEHYIPSAVTQIPQEYVFSKKDQWIHASAEPFLIKMLLVAEENSVSLQIISAYRTFDEQADVKVGHIVTYGAGTANQFSAEQGYSEHQLGTTVDFTTPEIGSSFSKFENTDAYQWLHENAHKFGFILSYPKGNEYYQYEPWHWRFVGVSLAQKLHNEGKNFYDLDQREIDKYLVDIFD